MSELSVVVDEESQLNAAWLPIEAANSRLTLLHYIRKLQRRAKSESLHRLGEPNVSRPAVCPEQIRVVPGDYFDDRNRLFTIALQQDIVWIQNRLPKLLEHLGFPGSWVQIQLPDPEGEALQGFTPDKEGWRPFEQEARQCLISGLTDVEIWLEESARTTELPHGWEPDASRGWPVAPVRNVAELKGHLNGLLATIQRNSSDPSNLEFMTRELRNTRRALRHFFHEVTFRPIVNDIPKDVFEAERELERLIDLLPIASVDQKNESALGEPNSGFVADKSEETQSTMTESTLPPRGPGKIFSVEPPLSGETILVLNSTCLGILKALDGRAMRIEELAKVVTGGEPTRLYRDGMKTILAENGMIVHDPKIGYFRPDAPPAERVAKVVKKDAKK